MNRGFLTAALLALVLSVLAAVGTPSHSESEEVVYVLDVSRSHGPAPDQLLDRLRQWHDASALAGAPYRVVQAGRMATFGDVPAPPGQEEGSRIDLGLELAARVRGAATRIVVLTDGRFDPDPVAKKVAALAADGVAVSFAGPLAAPALDMRLEPRGDARVEGGRARVRAAITGTNREPRTVSLTVSGGAEKSGATIVVAPGATEEWEALVPVAEGAASLGVRIALEDGPDAAPVNDALVVALVRSLPRAVVVGAHDDLLKAAIADALAGGGFAVERVGTLADATPAVLAGADLLVVVDQPVTGVPDDRIREIETAVTEFGLGLWVVGGPHAFGAGGYAGSRLDDLLPLSSRTATPHQVLVILDTSGSMDEDDRLARAIDTIVAMAGELAPDDRIQVLPFAERAEAPVPEAAASGAQFLAVSVPRLRQIAPRGGTRLLPALDAALALPRDPKLSSLFVTISDVRDDQVSDRDLWVRKRAMIESKIASIVVVLDPTAESTKRAGDFATDDVITVKDYGATIRARVRGQPGFLDVPGDSVLPDGKAGPRIAWRNAVREGKGALVALKTKDGEPLMASAFRGVGRTAAWAAAPLEKTDVAALAKDWAQRTARPADWKKIAARREGGRVLLTMPPAAVPAGPLSAAFGGGAKVALAERSPGVFEVPGVRDAGDLRVLDGDRLMAVVPVPPAGDPEYAWPAGSWPAPSGVESPAGSRVRAPWAALAALAWAGAVLLRQRRLA